MTIHKSIAARQIADTGERIRMARVLKNMSTAKLAGLLGVTERTLQRWETGISGPRANRLPHIAGALSVHLRWLMSGEGEPSALIDTPVVSMKDDQKLLKEVRDIRAVTLNALTQLDDLEKRLKRYARQKADESDGTPYE